MPFRYQKPSMVKKRMHSVSAHQLSVIFPGIYVIKGVKRLDLSLALKKAYEQLIIQLFAF